MSSNRIERHPLSQRHFRQIICRPLGLQEKMRSIWAVAWRPGDNTGSFLGKCFRPLGSAMMMVQASYPQRLGRDGIGLLGIAATVDAQNAVVSYSDLRLRHDFHRMPRVGARGPILDPSSGRRGNESWAQLALDVDRIRARAATKRQHLSTVPELPRIYLGYGRKDQAQFEVTTELYRRALADIAVSWQAGSIHELQRCHKDTFKKRELEFAALPGEDQRERLLGAWDAAFIPPTDALNTTGLWLLAFELSTNVYSSTRVFEFFGELTGAMVYNPARELSGSAVSNAAIEVATEANVDLVSDLTRLAETEQQSPEFLQIEQRIVGLIPAYRRRLNASEEVSDQDLLCALCDYNNPVVVQPPLESLQEGDQIRRMRSKLQPNIAECCRDEDLLAAARNPNGPLFAAGLCRVQTLHRDPGVRPSESMQFWSQSLGRERMEAKLWHDAWAVATEAKCGEATEALMAA